MAIKANELRVGNWVHNQNKKTVEVLTIEQNKISADGGGVDMFLHYFSGIPLSPEILMGYPLNWIQLEITETQ